MSRQVRNRVCSAFVISSPCRKFSTNEDAPLTISAPGVLANDVDADGNPITAILVDNVPASAGTLTLFTVGTAGDDIYAANAAVLTLMVGASTFTAPS